MRNSRITEKKEINRNLYIRGRRSNSIFLIVFCRSNQNLKEVRMMDNPTLDVQESSLAMKNPYEAM
jgi:hypothetical protein